MQETNGTVNVFNEVLHVHPVFFFGVFIALATRTDLAH